MNYHENGNEASGDLKLSTPDEVRAARNIAAHMAAMGGPDLSGKTDVELVTIMQQAAKVMADAFVKFGVTAAEAAESFERVAKALKEKNERRDLPFED